ncbi:MAG: adenosine deaminase [Anaerolineae bacterium]|nr:adenosine deaminase [Anaerolineae bacterium]
MPKVELHVHLEGSIQPSTLLTLAQRHQIPLPANTVEDLRQWFTFTDFPHFVEVYKLLSQCVRTPDDIELIAREFLLGQSAQNIIYSEATYTPYTHYLQKGISFADQLAAINRARVWAKQELGVEMRLIIDMDRSLSVDEAMTVAQWAISGKDNGVVALGLGGYEAGNPPEKFKRAFDLAHENDLPAVPHAGETAGAASIWGALNELRAVRIGHGVRCMEDPALVEELQRRHVLLEVSPTSNVCLGVFPSLEEHNLPRLLECGLNVSLNSDDPAIFNTSLTGEYQKCVETFALNADHVQQLILNGVHAALLPVDEKSALRERVIGGFARLRNTLKLPPLQEANYGSRSIEPTFEPAQVIVETPIFSIKRLKDDLFLITWLAMPSPAVSDEFIKTLAGVLDAADQRISVISDLRRGYIKEVSLIQKLAALTRHPRFRAATAFGSIGAQVYTGVYQRISERKGHIEDTWLTLEQAIAYLETQQPGLTAGIDWGAVAMVE